MIAPADGRGRPTRRRPAQPVRLGYNPAVLASFTASPTARRLVLLAALLAATWLRVHRLPELPPGLHYDEAANGVLAGDIGVRGARPIFIPSYTGKEVLFFYLAGGLSRLLGETPFALRLTAALIGVTTTAAAAWLGRELWPRRPWVGVWAAVLLATAFPHLVFSRLGFRVITLPLLISLTLAALWRGARRDSRPWALAAGALLGLTGYTYLAARLFPLLIAGALPLLFWRRGRRGAQQAALVLATALVVVAPLLFYFWRHPEAFWVRIGQVTPGEGGAAYLDGLARGLGMFFLQGDPYWRFNIPGRPLLGVGQALLWLIGAALLLWRARAEVGALPRLWLALAGPLIMVLPSALAVGEITPSNLRALGVWPLLLYPIALALSALTALRPLRPWAVPLALLLLGGQALLTGRAYFAEWTQRADLFYDSDADLLAVGRYLDATAAPDETLYVAALHYRHPTLAFTSRSYARVKWLVGGSAWVAPAAGPARVVFPHNVPPADWLAAQLPAPELGPPGPDGAPTFWAYRLEQPFVPALPHNQAADFGGVIALTGVDGEQTAAETLRIWLAWQATQGTAVGYRPFVHLLDDGGYRWAQADSIAYLAEQWAPGEQVLQSLDLTLPPGLPAGRYTLAIGLFADDAGRLTLRDATGGYAGSAVQVADLALTGNPAPPTAQPPFVVDRYPAPGLHLLGYERGGPTLEAGAPFWLALWWQAERPLPLLRTQLILTDAVGRSAVWLTTDPARGGYLFAEWPTPAFVRDHVAAVLPADWPPGDYALALQLVDAAGRPTGEAVPLGALTASATERRFDVPPTAETTTAVFGGEIALRGYTWQTTADEAVLTLVWQALAPPAQDYTVFVHLLTPEGVCCLWQQDVMPRQNSYPTTRWLAGEVVEDRYVIPTADLPMGRLPLEIGLYLAQTGQRLGVTTDDGATADHLFLTPLVIAR